MNSIDSPCLPYLRALSDETRWQIVQVLISSATPLSLGALAERLDITDYKASRHVAVLEDVGIIHTEKKGRNKFLCVAENLREHISSGSLQCEVLNLGCCSFEFQSEKTVSRNRN